MRNEQQKPWDNGQLSVKENCPYFFNGDKLFFWLGDTAWLMFHNLTVEEIEIYLRNRAEKGFNVIQVVAAHHLPAQNVYGCQAFQGQGISAPVAGGEHNYWEIVDFAVKEAERLGMYIALLPHWGQIAAVTDQSAMESYVHFLAQRYGNARNVIWVTGGDTRGNEAYDYWCTMGNILKKECPSQLVTFHPFGRTSSIDYFPEESWMDFHMFQSGHRRYDQRTLKAWDDSSRKVQDTESTAYYGEDNWRYVQEVEKLSAVKPILDAEPSYEHIPQGLHLENEPYWTKEQVRRYGWWSVLAGAAGFTYGHNSIMQFYTGEGKSAFFARLPWMDSLHAPACDAMVHMKRIMEKVLSESWKDAGCANELLGGSCVWQENQQEERILCFRGGEYILCYSYSGRAIELEGRRLMEYAASVTGKAGSHKAKGWWMYPESGVESYFGAVEVGGDNICLGTPEGDESHSDWLLILKIMK